MQLLKLMLVAGAIGLSLPAPTRAETITPEQASMVSLLDGEMQARRQVAVLRAELAAMKQTVALEHRYWAEWFAPPAKEDAKAPTE